MANQVYQIITDRIIESLENNQVPWQSGWSSSVRPSNAITGKSYQGINSILLMDAVARFGSPWFVTAKQAQSLGGRIKQSEWKRSSIVTYWKIYYKKSNDSQIDDGHDDLSSLEKRFVLRYYSVWNVKQCENVTLPDHCKDIEEKTLASLPDAEHVFNQWFDRSGVTLVHGQPSYSPSLDVIRMPHKQLFESSERYYSTGFHEIVHSTGHYTRMNRFTDSSVHFGSDVYSKEELVAEIGASFLRSMTGIDGVFDISVSYIKSWLRVLKNDPRMIISAASKAQKAADMIMVTVSGTENNLTTDEEIY